MDYLFYPGVAALLLIGWLERHERRRARHERTKRNIERLEREVL